MAAQAISAQFESEGFPLDHSLPEIKTASDGPQMLELFRRYLRPRNGHRYDIKDCIVTRIRRRESARCVLQYNLLLEDADNNSQQTQWATGVIYPETRSAHLWRKLQKAESQQHISGFNGFEPVSFIPELKMLVQLFPFDRRLPKLSGLLNRGVPEIESLLLSSFGPGNWRSEGIEIEPVRYRAGLAAVLRYTIVATNLQSRQRRKKRFYAKIYRDETRGRQVYDTFNALWLRKGTGVEQLTVPEPIAYLEDSHTLLQAEAAGIPFQQLLVCNSDQAAESAARRVGRSLAVLHLDQVPIERQHLLQHELEILERTRKTLEWARPHLRDQLDQIVRGARTALVEVPLRPTHLDLKTDHILLAGTSCNLLDLDSFALSDPLQDAAHMLAQIFGLRFDASARPERLRLAADAFREEYFNHVPGEWRERLRPHYAVAALKVALGFFRRQEQNWREKVTTLIREANLPLAT